MEDKNKLRELQARLISEQQELKKVLDKLGEMDDDDWVLKIREDDGFHADMNEEASDIGDAARDLGVMSALEVRMQNVSDALDRIDSGEYGACEVCGEEIEEDRLDANPAATTCIAHMEEGEEDADDYPEDLMES